ncbi:putative general amidase GmdA [Aulographum hederae CBS 113979]|uniref:amidase n=1 Tax=Aulographum hederae CBS 113979 TaxID=1176131 RepID=A0A6G1GVE5_9PEZI|nr:putative general amidase GmdA [Aulographum hederae CBS 113979]
MVADWEAKAQAKREEIFSSIPKEWILPSVPSKEEQKDVTGDFARQYLSDREVEITETDAVGITAKTTTGEWSAVEVTKAFCHRAAIAHQLLSCLHEIFFDAALASAKEMDNHFEFTKKPLGPLHGLPVSLKDQFHVKGVDTTMGYIGWIGTFEGAQNAKNYRTHESLMVQELRELGAVLYCKTSVPHTLMSGETVNNIIGYTLNPKNRLLTCGGSSGGEGALIGFRGSPIGFGTDIGGSIRIPAAFNGLFGLRPSSGRLPYEGMANSMDGQNTVLSVVGPLATTSASLTLMTKSILSRDPWLHDPLVHEIPWRDSHYDAMKSLLSSGSKLSFGVIRNDGITSPHPPVTRALEFLTSTLASAGHEITPWTPPPHIDAITLTSSIWTFDGGADVHAAFALSGEPPSSQISSVYGTSPSLQASASQIAAINVAKRKWQKAYMEYWNSTSKVSGTGRPVDAVICPVAPFAAARPGTYKSYSYMSVWNFLDYTGVVVPVTTVDKGVDAVDAGFQPIDEADRECQATYDPEIFDGAHVSLQLVGRRLQEEKMLAIAEYVGSVLAEAK